MKIAPAPDRPLRRGYGVRVSCGVESSRAAREKAELELKPAERRTLALELSGLCEQLAAAVRDVQQERL